MYIASKDGRHRITPFKPVYTKILSKAVWVVVREGVSSHKIFLLFATS
jgi:hypothetical protein